MQRLVLGLATIGILACGGGDGGSGPEDPFPDAAGVYDVTGTFDDLPANTASFSGTITLDQTSRESGALTGTAAILVDLDGDVFNITDDALGGANVSPAGVISFTVNGGGSSSWTFSGTLNGNAITGGRHTLSSGGGETLSGAWTGSRGTAGVVLRLPAMSVDDLAGRLRR